MGAHTHTHTISLSPPHLHSVPGVNVKLVDLLVAAAGHQHVLLPGIRVQRDAVVDLGKGKGVDRRR
jgi:hypothetical protein